MATSKWVYENATGRFLYGGFYEPTWDPMVETMVEFADADVPNIERERYDPTSPTKRRQATTQERADVVATDLNDDARAAMDLQSIKAAVISALWGRLGRQPTPAEIAAERTRYIDIYKALG